MNTQTTKITLDTLSDYLNSGPPLDDAISMIEMLRNYQEDVNQAVNDWTELIPRSWWGHRTDLDKIETIVLWLLKMGYVIGDFENYEGDNYCWHITKGDKDGRFYSKGIPARYSVEGLPRPEESPNDARRMPEFLTWD